MNNNVEYPEDCRTIIIIIIGYYYWVLLLFIIIIIIIIIINEQLLNLPKFVESTGSQFFNIEIYNHQEYDCCLARSLAN